jgi:hypothetical protein
VLLVVTGKKLKDGRPRKPVDCHEVYAMRAKGLTWVQISARYKRIAVQVSERVLRERMRDYEPTPQFEELMSRPIIEPPKPQPRPPAAAEPKPVPRPGAETQHHGRGIVAPNGRQVGDIWIDASGRRHEIVRMTAAGEILAVRCIEPEPAPLTVEHKSQPKLPSPDPPSFDPYPLPSGVQTHPKYDPSWWEKWKSRRDDDDQGGGSMAF